MSTLLIVALLVILIASGSVGYNQFGGRGLGGVLALFLFIITALWTLKLIGLS